MILLEGDDYTGPVREPRGAARDAPQPHEILAPVELAQFAPDGTAVEPAGMITVAGLHDPVEVIRFGCAAAGTTASDHAEPERRAARGGYPPRASDQERTGAASGRERPASRAARGVRA